MTRDDDDPDAESVVIIEGEVVDPDEEARLEAEIERYHRMGVGVRR